MNNLQKLIRLKGKTYKDVAGSIGLGYHTVQKAIKGIRSIQKTRDAIADHLGLDMDRAWGPGSDKYLKDQIREAIKHCAAAERKRLEKRYL